MEIFALLIVVVLISCVVPIIQWISVSKSLKKRKEYSFSEQLFDLDLDDLIFENTSRDENIVNRLALADRGWVRCPVGIIITNEMFEKKKKSEYAKELP